MNKVDVVRTILRERRDHHPHASSGSLFAPTNIALCKYWGKRNQALNLPVTASLSVSLGDKGAITELTIHDHEQDQIWLNGQPVAATSTFSQRLINFLNLFRDQYRFALNVQIETNVPIAAGLASSACGFASIVMALNSLFRWELNQQALSILARLGSGSACRSIWSGFVEWHAGNLADGMDSHGSPIVSTWPELCIGLLIVNDQEKGLSSREAMQRTVSSSALYSAWPAKVNADLALLKQAIDTQDFELFGQTAESNAMSMHATMLSAWPPVSYAIPETLLAMRLIWKLRDQGLPLYFTQDAGPNLKLLFLQKDIEMLKSYFPQLDIIQPFTKLM